MLRNKQSSIVALSHLPPVTAQNSVLQEARLVLMCHRWGLLKTRFIPSVSEHRGNADWLPIIYTLGNEMKCHKLIKSWLGFHLHLSGSNFTLHYTCWSHTAKFRQNFKLLFGLIYLRLELTQNFRDHGMKAEDWLTPKMSFLTACRTAITVNACFLHPQEKTKGNSARFGLGHVQGVRVSLTVPPDGSFTFCAREERYR